MLCNREHSPGCFVFRVIRGLHRCIVLAHDQWGALNNKTHQKGYSLQIPKFLWVFLKVVWLLSVFHFHVSHPCNGTVSILLQDHPGADWAGWCRVEREASRHSPGASVGAAAPQGGATQRRGPPGSSWEGGQGCRSVLSLGFSPKAQCHSLVCYLCNKSNVSWTTILGFRWL